MITIVKKHNDDRPVMRKSNEKKLKTKLKSLNINGDIYEMLDLRIIEDEIVNAVIDAIKSVMKSSNENFYYVSHHGGLTYEVVTLARKTLNYKFNEFDVKFGFYIAVEELKLADFK